MGYSLSMFDDAGGSHFFLVDFPVFRSLHLELHEGLRGDAHVCFLPDQKAEGNICCEHLGSPSLQIQELQAMLVFHQIQVMGEKS